MSCMLTRQAPEHRTPACIFSRGMAGQSCPGELAWRGLSCPFVPCTRVCSQSAVPGEELEAGENILRRLLKQGFAFFLLSFWLPLSDSWSLPTIGDLEATKPNQITTTPPRLSKARDLDSCDAVLCCMVCSEHWIN